MFCEVDRPVCTDVSKDQSPRAGVAYFNLNNKYNGLLESRSASNQPPDVIKQGTISKYLAITDAEKLSPTFCVIFHLARGFPGFDTF